MLMYSRFHPSPGVSTVVFIYMCVICDLKSCPNYVELDTGAAGAKKLFQRGE